MGGWSDGQTARAAGVQASRQSGNQSTNQQAHQKRQAAEPPRSQRPPPRSLDYLVRLPRAEQVKVLGGAPQQQVPHRAPHHVRLVPCETRGEGTAWQAGDC